MNTTAGPTTHTVTWSDGATSTRRSAAQYIAASRRAGTVRWHKSVAAARDAAGRQGEVQVIAQAAAVRSTSCVVCGDDPRGVPSRSAVTGEITWTPCWGGAHRR